MTEHPRSGRARALLASYPWLAALLGGTLVLGLAGVGAPLRPLFVLGCAAISYDAWRRGAAAHIQVAITLFCLAPFLRRIVDYHAGFDPSGLMLVGPLLAILVPVIDLRVLFQPGRAVDPALRPALIVAGCITYAALLTLAQGDLAGTASGLLKWLAPLLYGMWLFERARGDASVLPAAVRAFLLVMPVLGAYAVLQYVSPPDWDRYWMLFARMDSIGYPRPYQVRVFSTMNSPASFATYMVLGLLLVGFCRSGWTALLLALPCTVGLLLSLYRTAWIELVVAVLFCALFGATRARAVMLASGGAAAVMATMTVPPFSDVIATRLSSLSNGSQDGSARERLAQYSTLLNADGGTLVGHGYVTVDTGRIGLLLDGQIIGCWHVMGLAVGMICIAALVWAAGQGMVRTAGSRDPAAVVLGAVMAGSLAVIPLQGVASGESGFLFWSFASLAAAGTPYAVRRAREHDAGRSLAASRI